MDPGQESARLRAEEAASRRRHDVDVGEGKTRFAADLAAQDKHGRTDFSLDLLSAFATAYAIGFGDGHCDSGIFPLIFSEESLYNAAGVPPHVKAAFIDAYTVGGRRNLSKETQAEAEPTFANVAKNASEVGFVSWELPVGNEACRTYDTGYNAGEESAYTVARQAAYDAVIVACNGNTDIAEQVANAIIEAAPTRIVREESERRRRTAPPASRNEAVLLQFVEELETIGRPNHLLARVIREANQHRRAMRYGPPFWGANA
jgi:hypothetical protein